MCPYKVILKYLRLRSVESLDLMYETTLTSLLPFSPLAPTWPDSVSVFFPLQMSTSTWCRYSNECMIHANGNVICMRHKHNTTLEDIEVMVDLLLGLWLYCQTQGPWCGFCAAISLVGFKKVCDWHWLASRRHAACSHAVCWHHILGSTVLTWNPVEQILKKYLVSSTTT